MRLWQKFCDSHVKFARNSYETRTKFVRISNEFRTNFTFSEYSHISIRVKFARNSYEFRTNFVQIYVNFFQLHANHSRESCLREGDGRKLAMTACPFNRSCISHHATAQGAIPSASGSYTTAAPTRAPPWYAFEPQGCSRLECSQWEQFPPEQFLWGHHWNKCRRPDNQIHHHEFPSA